MLCLVVSCFIGIMASFNLMEDDDFGSMFLTQQSTMDNVVSLEEEGGFRTVFDEKYSDVSDFEEDSMEERLR